MPRLSVPTPPGNPPPPQNFPSRPRAGTSAGNQPRRGGESGYRACTPRRTAANPARRWKHLPGRSPSVDFAFAATLPVAFQSLGLRTSKAFTAHMSPGKALRIACAIVATLLLAAILLEARSTVRSNALAMPKAGRAFDERVIEIRADWFDAKTPAVFEFEPSEETRQLAKRHMTLDGIRPRTWYSYVPKDGVRMPLVILFHGAGRDGLSMIEMWKDTAQRHGVALVAPNSWGATWSLDDLAPQFLADIASEIAPHDQIDGSRVFLFGHSDGAVYAQVLLNRTQGPWLAAATHGGYAPPDHLRPAQTARPIRMYLGEEDEIFDLDRAREVAGWFARHGSRTELLVIPDHNHWFYEIGPQVADDAWTWFSSLPD